MLNLPICYKPEAPSVSCSTESACSSSDGHQVLLGSNSHSIEVNEKTSNFDLQIQSHFKRSQFLILILSRLLGVGVTVTVSRVHHRFLTDNCC